jgi:hypothetical protein
MKNKRMNIRLTQAEFDAISERAKRANLTLTEYITKSCLGKQIFVIDGIDELNRQHRALGNNINQLTKLANAGQIRVINLDEFLAEYGAIGKSIIELMDRRRWR